ncbi:RHS repeat-associated core domain-containing protein [Pseudomonas izuensis]|uniref:Teneurin-like YD-shell domain-containing protein n=1 Tax=Pseudomonas izuensis TaxID=2684212 RepID=A0ABM7RR64_9PSED|nr:RHS repeat-associated core domain-containing protein [Pseudomonas izuensis]BCX65597.1 hypothetical protein LAB08_R02000 [Pseudomonas izuensis]
MMLKTEVCRYRYDALDQLIGREPAGQEKLQRFYRHKHLTTELQGQASQSVFQHDMQLLALQSCQDDVLNSELLAIDQQRSVLQVTGTSGSVRQVYTAYGHRKAENGLGSLLGFNGEAVDRLTGHYLLGNGHRAFNPVLMRFNSPDRLSPFGRGGLNAYAYCQGDPVNFSDPTGQFSRLVTSLFSVFNARIVFEPAIPFKLAKDALQWGAAGQLPGRVTLGAAGSTIAGVTTMLAAVTGVGAAVAAINKDTEAAAIFGMIALGLGAVTFSARMGSFWAARDPKTIPALKHFVESRGRVSISQSTSPSSPLASAPPLSPDPFAGATAPPLTASPTSTSQFPFPSHSPSGVGTMGKRIRRNSV